MRKIIFKENILAIFIIAMLVYGIYAFFREPVQHVNADMEACKTRYMDMLCKLDGKSDPEKQQYVQSQVKKVETAHLEQEKTVQAYLEGTITKEEYTKELLKQSGKLRNSDVISIIASQTEYVLGDQSSRYYIYPNGWIHLFEGTEVNYIVFFLVLLSVTPVFCNEYETGMYAVNFVTSGGHRFQYAVKIAAGMCIAAVISLVLNMENILIVALRFGLSGFTYPVQSIFIFSNCPWDRSTGEVFLLYVLLGLAAALFCAAIIFFLSVLLKKTIPAVLMACSMIFIPLFLLEEKDMYRFPLPVCLLRRQGYVTGVYSVDTGQKEFCSWGSIASVLLWVAAVSLLLLFIAKKLFIFKKAISFVLIILLLLTGCSSRWTVDGECFNDKGWGNVFWTDYGIIDATGSDIMVKDSDGSRKVVTEPFLQEDRENLKIAGVLGVFVYLVHSYEETGDYDIIKLNLSTQEQELIYEHHAYLLNGTDYLGMQERMVQSRNLSVREQVYSCFAMGKNLYLLTNGSIYEVNLLTGKRTIVADNLGLSSMSYINGRIYYINEEKKLISYDTAEKKRRTVDEELVSGMMALEDKMVIQHMSGEIVSMDYISGKFTLVSDKAGDMLYADQNAVYCNDEPKTIHVIDIDTGKNIRSVSMQHEICEVKSSPDGEEIYIVTVKDNCFYLDCVTR